MSDCTKRNYGGCEDELSRLRAENAELAAQNVAMRERMDRARNILTNGKPTPNCNWGMLDTAALTDTLAADILAQRDAALVLRVLNGEVFGVKGDRIIYNSEALK